MNHDLLDGLYATRRELTRLLVQTATENVPTSVLQELIQKRDHVIWTVNRILASDLTSSLADVSKAVDAIDASTDGLKALTGKAEDIAKAIGIANQVFTAAEGLLAAN